MSKVFLPFGNLYIRQAEALLDCGGFSVIFRPDPINEHDRRTFIWVIVHAAFFTKLRLNLTDERLRVLHFFKLKHQGHALPLPSLGTCLTNWPAPRPSTSIFQQSLNLRAAANRGIALTA